MRERLKIERGRERDAIEGGKSKEKGRVNDTLCPTICQSQIPFCQFMVLFVC